MGGSSLLVNLTVFRYNSGAQGGALGMEGGGQLQVRLVSLLCCRVHSGSQCAALIAWTVADNL